jgi:predicted metal-binding membrane protein
MTLVVVTGMMNLATMALAALAITVERLAHEPALVVRLAGLLVIGAGALEIVRAL